MIRGLILILLVAFVLADDVEKQLEQVPEAPEEVHTDQKKPEDVVVVGDSQDVDINQKKPEDVVGSPEEVKEGQEEGDSSSDVILRAKRYYGCCGCGVSPAPMGGCGCCG
ncbi:unnamed protein product [Caenorhabditis auriculariae]|uniref:Uncharacterized protein n=1 Tax=Caenorhabditis auriculariae TaxID=2777116 RepID=A0A8S1H8F5_9PELO|nr:unnamed protein product [Caenorhabditis auriculariae]